jgi:HD-like signal output (HDOD) protein
MKAAREFIYDLAEKISMPDVYLEIRKLMDNPNAKITDYEKLVENDPMLAIRIIRIANSEFFGFNRKAIDLYSAISLIGVIQLHDLLLSSLCMRTFYNIPEQIFNFNDFWRHGIRCGIASRSLAKMCRLPASNRFFTLGLLLEIGHAAMFVKSPDMALKVLLESQQQGRSIDKVEFEYFGFDYCQLGSVLMHQWRLPEVYSQIIGHHLYPEQSKSEYRIGTEIVNYAHQICEKPGYINLPAPQALSSHSQLAGLPGHFEETIAKEILDYDEQVFVMLSPPSANSNTMNSLGI